MTPCPGCRFCEGGSAGSCCSFAYRCRTGSRCRAGGRRRIGQARPIDECYGKVVVAAGHNSHHMDDVVWGNALIGAITPPNSELVIGGNQYTMSRACRNHTDITICRDDLFGCLSDVTCTWIQKANDLGIVCYIPRIGVNVII